MGWFPGAIGNSSHYNPRTSLCLSRASAIQTHPTGAEGVTNGADDQRASNIQLQGWSQAALKIGIALWALAAPVLVATVIGTFSVLRAHDLALSALLEWKPLLVQRVMALETNAAAADTKAETKFCPVFRCDALRRNITRLENRAAIGVPPEIGATPLGRQ